MIIWLASYPRSGNTVTRTILKKCFDIGSYSDDPADSFISQESAQAFGHISHTEDWPVFYSKALNSPELFFIKTHRPPIDDSPCIYIVRDGRAASWSYYNFMSDFFPEAKRSLLQIIVGNDHYGSWSDHYKAWVQRHGARTLELNFATLPEASTELIGTLAAFAGHKGPITPWENPMQDLRRRDPHFFRTGSAVWNPPAEWTPSLDSLFWHRHGDLMEELGFDQRPKPTLPADYGLLLAEISSLSSTWINTHHYLLKTCEERQGVIDSLTKTCEERQGVIDSLTKTCEERQGVIDGLAKTCEERLQLIQKLDKTLRVLRSP